MGRRLRTTAPQSCLVGKSERRKGTGGELEVANLFRDRGLDMRRVPNSGGLDIKGDLRGAGSEGYHFEVKRQENLALPAWLKQAREEAGPSDVPCVIFRRSREDWQVVIPLKDFLDLYEAKRKPTPLHPIPATRPE